MGNSQSAAHKDQPRDRKGQWGHKPMADPPAHDDMSLDCDADGGVPAWLADLRGPAYQALTKTTALRLDFKPWSPGGAPPLQKSMPYSLWSKTCDPDVSQESKDRIRQKLDSENRLLKSEHYLKQREGLTHYLLNETAGPQEMGLRMMYWFRPLDPAGLPETADAGAASRSADKQNEAYRKIRERAAAAVWAGERDTRFGPDWDGAAWAPGEKPVGASGPDAADIAAAIVHCIEEADQGYIADMVGQPQDWMDAASCGPDEIEDWRSECSDIIHVRAEDAKAIIGVCASEMAAMVQVKNADGEIAGRLAADYDGDTLRVHPEGDDSDCGEAEMHAMEIPMKEALEVSVQMVDEQINDVIGDPYTWYDGP